MKKIFGFCRVILLALAVIGMYVSNASASIVYSYLGNNFDHIIDSTPPAGTTYDTSMFVEGSFTTQTILGPSMPMTPINGLIQSFSFSDGFTELTNVNTTSSDIEVATDSSGAIIQWDINLNIDSFSYIIGDQSFQIQSVNQSADVFDSGRLSEIINVSPDGLSVTGQYDEGKITNNPGTWSVVPIPSALWLLGSGLIGIVGIRRRINK